MKLILIASVSASALLGCVTQHKTVALTPQGQQVLILMGVPSGCAQLGDVFGKFTADDPEQAALGARIQIRNKGAAMGANVVVLQTNNATADYQDVGFGQAKASRQAIVLGGLALRCPPNAQPAAPPQVATPPVPGNARSL